MLIGEGDLLLGHPRAAARHGGPRPRGRHGPERGTMPVNRRP